MRNAQSLIEATDATICLTGQYAKNEIYDIFRQRLNFLGWALSDYKSIANKIIENSSNISDAIDLLVWSKRVSVALNSEKIMLKHLNQAVNLFKSNNQIKDIPK